VDPVDGLARRVASGVRSDRSFVVAIAGPVAVGKSTLAARLADRVRAEAHTVEVVATDGFLLPNVELARLGLLDRKGIPATYDLEHLEAVVGDAHAGRSPLEVPVYSHEHYDVEDEPWRFVRPEVLVVEGVVALQRPIADLGVYLDADRADLERWYVERFRALVAAAADDPASFYRGWVGLDDDEIAALARDVWRLVNLPNLDEHIEATRANADVVLEKGADHALR